jgi:hypothetical protein
MMRRNFQIPPDFVVRSIPHSAKASRGEDLDVEEPVVCWYAPAFDFHPTLAGMHGATVIRHQVVQVRESRQKCLLSATGMVKAFHGEQFPLDGVMGLV